jgi:glycosyltransferase involved in cell wall biosynthesis
MAVRNAEKFLGHAIDSVLAQSFTDFEFIIVDDDSYDRSAEIVQSYSDRRIKYVRNREHLGLTSSLNLGLEQAQGKYIARMDADDISLPDRFAEQVQFLDRHPEVCVLGTGIRLIDAEGNSIRDVKFPSDADLIKWSLCFYNPIVHSTALMRRQLVQEIGGYNPAYKRSQDYDLWWRISSLGMLANLDEIHALLRQHSGQVTNTDRDHQFRTGVAINQKHLSTLLGKPVSKEVIQKLWGRDYSTIKDALDVSQLVFDIYKAVHPLIRSKAMNKIVANDALSRILPILLPHLMESRIRQLLWESIAVNPLGFVRTFGKLAPGFLSKSVRAKFT